VNSCRVGDNCPIGAGSRHECAGTPFFCDVIYARVSCIIAPDKLKKEPIFGNDEYLKRMGIVE